MEVEKINSDIKHNIDKQIKEQLNITSLTEESRNNNYDEIMRLSNEHNLNCSNIIDNHNNEINNLKQKLRNLEMVTKEEKIKYKVINGEMQELNKNISIISNKKEELKKVHDQQNDLNEDLLRKIEELKRNNEKL
jgi:hypothetical protein